MTVIPRQSGGHKEHLRLQKDGDPGVKLCCSGEFFGNISIPDGAALAFLSLKGDGFHASASHRSSPISKRYFILMDSLAVIIVAAFRSGPRWGEGVSRAP